VVVSRRRAKLAEVAKRSVNACWQKVKNPPVVTLKTILRKQNNRAIGHAMLVNAEADKR
jgi:hypothetical protein